MLTHVEPRPLDTHRAFRCSIPPTCAGEQAVTHSLFSSFAALRTTLLFLLRRRTPALAPARYASTSVCKGPTKSGRHRLAVRSSRFILAMKCMRISFGQAPSHSP